MTNFSLTIPFTLKLVIYFLELCKNEGFIAVSGLFAAQFALTGAVLFFICERVFYVSVCIYFHKCEE